MKVRDEGVEAILLTEKGKSTPLRGQSSTCSSKRDPPNSSLVAHSGCLNLKYQKQKGTIQMITGIISTN